MSINDEISRLSTAKTNLATAIQDKGVTVPQSELLSNYYIYVQKFSKDGGNADSCNGLHFQVSSSIPTVDDKSMITFVV